MTTAEIMNAETNILNPSDHDELDYEEEDDGGGGEVEKK